MQFYNNETQNSVKTTEAYQPQLQEKKPITRSKKNIKKYIRKYFGKKVLKYLVRKTDVNDRNNLVIATATRFNILKLQSQYYNTIVNLRRINDIRYVNKYFEIVNAKLPDNGTFLGCVETRNLRKRRVLKKYQRYLNYIAYTGDFIIKQIFPKLPFTKRIYFLLTRGNNRVMSRAEALGRLYSCGFYVIDESVVDGYRYFHARKAKEPEFNLVPNYGLLIKLPRIGKHGKIIQVYKIRTMYPFSEYIQEYVHKHNNIKQGGKFKHDFRITTIGKVLRENWLDELPMCINVLKGEIKLVGVRPLSRHYFNLYTRELREKRCEFKPGLIPPFYADLPDTLEGIMESELKYLEKYENHPLKTDIQYFFRAVHNIIFKKARSK